MSRAGAASSMWWFFSGLTFLSLNLFFVCLGTAALMEVDAVGSVGAYCGAAVAVTNDKAWAKMHTRVGVFHHLRMVVSYLVALCMFTCSSTPGSDVGSWSCGNTDFTAGWLAQECTGQVPAFSPKTTSTTPAPPPFAWKEALRFVLTVS